MTDAIMPTLLPRVVESLRGELGSYVRTYASIPLPPELPGPQATEEVFYTNEGSLSDGIDFLLQDFGPTDGFQFGCADLESTYGSSFASGLDFDVTQLASTGSFGTTQPTSTSSFDTGLDEKDNPLTFCMPSNLDMTGRDFFAPGYT
jgi:hypothetical protein